MIKKLTLLLVGLAVIGAAKSYAANGDLLVNGKIGIGNGSVTPPAKLTLYDAVGFDPTAIPSQTQMITMGDINAANSWHATGLCSGNATAGYSPVCMGASESTWYFGFQNSPTTMMTTAALYSNGTLVLTGGLVQYSDNSLKKDIQDISAVLPKLKNFRGVNYKWKDDNWDQRRQLGVIAQEVEALYPELVMEVNHPSCTDAASCTQPKEKAVDYSKLSVIALQGVKELSEKVESLEKRLETLEKMLNR